MAQRESSGTEGSGTIVERFAEVLGRRFNVATSYGEPIERDGTTVVPVALVGYGLGAGSGASDAEGSGAGGGGGGSVMPVGYIQMRNGVTTFHPIGTVVSRVAVILAGGVAGMLVLRGIARVLEAGSHRHSEP